MASVVIQKRKRKHNTSYIITYRDPLTFKSKYHKTCKRYKDAQREANELRDLIDNGNAPEKPKSKKARIMTFSEVVFSLKNEWLNRFARKELSQDTLDGYVLRSDVLCKTFGNRILSQITKSEIEQFHQSQLIKISSATANRNLFILKQIFKQGRALNAIFKDDIAGIKYFSEKEHERNRFLSPDEIQTLIDASQKVRGKFYLPALIYLGAEHGTSKQEALTLLWKDIDFDYQGSGLIRIFRTKNGHERTEFLMPNSRQALLDRRAHIKWMRKRKRIKAVSDEFVFGRLNGTPIKRFDSAWGSLCEMAGFDDLNYHDLRHTFCSNLILSGSDLKDVKEMIGHRDLSTTDRYSHLTAIHKKHNQERLAAHYAR